MNQKRICLTCRAALCECPGVWMLKIGEAQGVCKLCGLGAKCPAVTKAEIEEARK